MPLKGVMGVDINHNGSVFAGRHTCTEPEHRELKHLSTCRKIYPGYSVSSGNEDGSLAV